MVPMIEWMILPLRRYAQFSGRARPKEYWLFALFCILASIVATLIDYIFGFGTIERMLVDEPGTYAAAAVYEGGGPVLLIFMLATFIPGLAVTVRRLHDSDKSGWWLLLGLIPFVGGIVLLVFMIVGGTHGPNRFGPDPVERPPIAA
jgi:uncharacterized membrane protein YhaH (DUF805 family)